MNHIWLELPTRASDNTWFSYLQQQGTDIYASAAQTTSKTQIVLESLDDLKANQGYGPYRFYIYDPDGFRLELHTWEGVED
ncbi:MAG: VOC family protein [Deinococcota bacterium]